VAASQLPIRALIKEDLPSAPLQQHLGFAVVGESLWMVRGVLPALSLNDVYGLACLELG
jgi:ribosomal-protein-alanine N-acetyltransferase